MTSLERIRCAARRLKSDAVPVAPYMGNHGAHVAGVPIGQYCRSGARMAEAQFRAWQLYGQDAVVAQSDNYYIAEGFGAEVQHYADSTPTLKTPAARDLGDIERLRVPNPCKDGRMPVYLEAIRLLAQQLGGAVAVRAPGTGPFSLASHLLGTERFLIELAMADKRPDSAEERALRHLLDLTAEALIRFAKACLEAGAHLVQAGDSLASLDMISPAMYRKWAWPAERRFFEALNPIAERYGAATLLHICGNMTPVLDLMADTGAHILELDFKVDLKIAKERVGRRVCLMGNLNPVELLWRGTPGQVIRASRKAIADAGQDGGFILGSGCEVPVAAPPQNIGAMIDEARAARSSSSDPPQLKDGQSCTKE
ncbi:MAG: uroporphyrinogen decarboxylase family protein [Verrucomicrobiota bacterium]|jgi:uroporphyrinogen decarboxylase